MYAYGLEEIQNLILVSRSPASISHIFHESDPVVSGFLERSNGGLMATMELASSVWPLTKVDDRLGYSIYNVNQQDLTADFDREAKRLFADEEEDLDVVVTALSKDGSTTRHEFTTTNQILAYVIRSTPMETGTTTVIEIRQAFSWGELDISLSSLQALFTSHGLTHACWPVLKLFGSREGAEHEFCGGFNDFRREQGDGSFELSYSLKHVEKNGREEGDPWSIRQMGVLQKYDAEQDRNTIVLLNPSAALKNRSDKIVYQGSALSQIHLLILQSTSERWSEYLQYLEAMSTRLVSALCFGLDPLSRFVITG